MRVKNRKTIEITIGDLLEWARSRCKDLPPNVTIETLDIPSPNEIVGGLAWTDRVAVMISSETSS
jgi:hypothetical protein